MFKKILLILFMLFTFSCEDNIVEEESSMKLWLNGEEVDIRYKKKLKELKKRDPFIYK